MSQLDKTKIALDERANYSKIKKSKRTKGINKMAEDKAPKQKRYTKTRGEHYKDIVIAVLVTAIVSFIVGVQYADNKQAEIDKAVSRVEQTAQTPVKK